MEKSPSHERLASLLELASILSTARTSFFLVFSLQEDIVLHGVQRKRKLTREILLPEYTPTPKVLAHHKAIFWNVFKYYP